MQKYVIGFVVVFVMMSGAVLAQSFSTEGLNFVAPVINGRANVGSPIAIGEIVFDTATPAGFFGYNGATWIDMNAGASAVPSGTITAFGGVTLPTGYVFCDGAPYTAATYPTLAAALWDSTNSKYAYGGSGTYPSGSFNVPDLRGKFLRGVSGSTSNDPDRTTRTASTTGGNTGNNVGSVQGQATSKNGLNLTDPGHSHAKILAPQPTGSGNGTPQSSQGSETTRSTTDAAATTGITLGNGDAETRPANVYVNYIIKL